MGDIGTLLQSQHYGWVASSFIMLTFPLPPPPWNAASLFAYYYGLLDKQWEDQHPARPASFCKLCWCDGALLSKMKLFSDYGCHAWNNIEWRALFISLNDSFLGLSLLVSPCMREHWLPVSAAEWCIGRFVVSIWSFCIIAHVSILLYPEGASFQTHGSHGGSQSTKDICQCPHVPHQLYLHQ